MNIDRMREAAKYIRTSKFDADDAVSAMTAALGLGFEFCRYLDDSPITAEALEEDGWGKPERSDYRHAGRTTVVLVYERETGGDGVYLTLCDDEAIAEVVRSDGFTASAEGVTTMGALRAATELVR